VKVSDRLLLYSEENVANKLQKTCFKWATTLFPLSTEVAYRALLHDTEIMYLHLESILSILGRICQL
jgi:hypothetical protein